MDKIEIALIWSCIGAAVGIAVYHYGFSTIRSKLDELIALIKSKV